MEAFILDAVLFTVVSTLLTNAILLIDVIFREKPIDFFDTKWLIDRGIERVEIIIKESYEQQNMNNEQRKIWVADRIKKDRNDETNKKSKKGN